MKKYIFFGAGKIGKKYLEAAHEMGLEVLAFCDNDSSRWGTQYCQKDIISPDMLLQKKYENCAVVVAMANPEKTYKQLEEMGIHCERDFFDKILIFKKRLRICFSNKQMPIDNKANDCRLSVVIDARFCTTEETDRCMSTVMANKITESFELLVWSPGKNCPETRGEAVFLIQGSSLLSEDAISNMLFTYRSTRCLVAAKEIDENYKIIQAGYEIVNGNWASRGNNSPFFTDKFSYAKSVSLLSNNGVLIPCKFWNLYREKLLCGIEESMTWIEVVQDALEKDYELYMQPYALIMSNRLKAEIWNESIALAVKEKNISFPINSSEWMMMFDEMIAQYDTNAGHRTTCEYMGLFRELGREIAYLLCYFDVLSPYVEYYQKQGIYVVYDEKYKSKCDEFIYEAKGDIKFAFINRPEVAYKYVPLLRKYPDIRIVHYGLDLHHIRLYREYEITKDEAKRKEAEKMKQLECSLIEQVDCSGYPSDLEVEYLKKDFPNANIQFFPILYFDSLPTEKSSDNREGILFVGGFNHAPNVDAVIWLIEEILPELRSRGIKDKVYIVGSNPTEKMLAYASDDIIFTGYISDDELVNLYQRCRICIAPLRYGAGMKGKVLEAMYNGIPLVTTDIGAEGLKDVNQVIAVANTVSEIVDEVQKLGEYGNDCLTDRIKMAQEYVMKHFGKQRLLNLFQRELQAEKTL